MRSLLLVLVVLVVCVGMSQAQVTPMTLNLGPAAGVAMPLGDYSTSASTGWTAGADARFTNLLPFGLHAAFMYASLANNTSNFPSNYPSFKFTEWNLELGPEFSFPSPGVTPYVGADLMYNMLNTDQAGSTATSRFGIGLGGGVQFGSIDVSAKYQILNLIGKQDQTINGVTVSETTVSKIAITVAYLFPVI